jgi:adenine deaminase
VTLNPAKQLKIDQYVGSISAGKHADFVVWNAHPLSAYAQPQQTWINGRKYFDREVDQQLRAAVETEKQALMQKLLAAPEQQRQGAEQGYKKQQPTWHCDDNHDVWWQVYSDHSHAQHGGQH